MNRRLAYVHIAFCSATLMAAGGSAPELFTSFIGTFQQVGMVAGARLDVGLIRSIGALMCGTLAMQVYLSA